MTHERPLDIHTHDGQVHSFPKPETEGSPNRIWVVPAYGTQMYVAESYLQIVPGDLIGFGSQSVPPTNNDLRLVTKVEMPPPRKDEP